MLSRPFSFNGHTTGQAKAVALGNSSFARLFARGASAEFYVQPIVAASDTAAATAATNATNPAPANDAASGWAHIITGDVPFEIGKENGRGFVDANFGDLFTHLLVWTVVAGTLEGIAH